MFRVADLAVVRLPVRRAVAQFSRRQWARILAASVVVFTVVTIGVTTNGASAQEADISQGCGSEPTLTSGTHTIQSGGIERSFILKVPDGYDSNYAHRLIFGLHWWGGTAEQVATGGRPGTEASYFGLESQANGTAIFVAPQGIDNAWANSGGQDVAFVDDMIALIEGDLCVDQSQRFSTGFSYGGAMSFSLACSRPDEFRAVAAIAAPGQVSGCDGGTQPVAYMGLHGVSDSGGGRALRDQFVANNGCTPQNPPEPAAGSQTHVSTAYSGCQDGYPVVWAAFDGGHQQAPVDGCGDCEDITQSWIKNEVWAFFAQFGDA